MRVGSEIMAGREIIMKIFLMSQTMKQSQEPSWFSGPNFENFCLGLFSSSVIHENKTVSFILSLVCHSEMNL